MACEGILYRGTNLTQPEEVWDYPRKRWVPYSQHALEPGDPQWISDAEAKALMVDNAAAEHFRYYDTPPWAQPAPDARAPYTAAPSRRAYKIFEYDGAWFRMPAERTALIVDEVRHSGGWTRYTGDRVKPAVFGNFVGVEEVDA